MFAIGVQFNIVESAHFVSLIEARHLSSVLSKAKEEGKLIFFGDVGGYDFVVFSDGELNIADYALIQQIVASYVVIHSYPSNVISDLTRFRKLLG